MLKTYQSRWKNMLTDLEKGPLEPGAWIQMADIDQPRRDVLMAIMKVEQLPSKTVRKVTLKIITSENANYHPGEDRIIIFDALGMPIKGIYLKDGPDSDMTALRYSESASLAACIISYLKALDMRGNKASTTEISKKLKEQGVIKLSLNQVRARELVMKVVKLTPDVLEHVGGGQIRLLSNREIDLRKEQALVSTAANFQDVKYVDQDLFIRGHLLLAESGFYGNITWTGKRKYKNAE